MINARRLRTVKVKAGNHVKHRYIIIPQGRIIRLFFPGWRGAVTACPAAVFAYPGFYQPNKPVLFSKAPVPCRLLHPKPPLWKRFLAALRTSTPFHICAKMSAGHEHCRRANAKIIMGCKYNRYVETARLCQKFTMQPHKSMDMHNVRL